MSTAIRSKKVRPGDEVAAYCGRCKDERTHQVIALNSDGVPATVICRTCGEQHRFRLNREREATARKSTGASPRRAGTGASRTATHKEAPPVSARPYSPRETFAEGEWLDHPKFGVGRVTAARAGKIEVRFDGDVRVLLHAG
jgi:hypothetical protein